MGGVWNSLKDFSDRWGTAHAFEISLRAEPIQYDRDVDPLSGIV